MKSKEEISGSIFRSIVSELFDVPIMGNLYRPHYVERLIVTGLGANFTLMSADWSGWDISHETGIKIEVKQSAARQTWTDRQSLNGKATEGSFDIAPRSGYWADGGSRWVEHQGRVADIYIFAWHPIQDKEAADHRDPNQWQFFIVPASELPPNQKTISRRVVARRWKSCSFEELRQRTLDLMQSLKQSSPQSQNHIAR